MRDHLCSCGQASPLPSFRSSKRAQVAILEGEDFNLTVDDLATYLRLVEESMASEKR
jgi:hypothetical protein